ncbi:sulfite exporter TauE/SafE family protein [Cognatishimia sp. WU-CL00825]|uniref:sulfite exporter TauE/SafE family protein n=1 Tax=Cognatishimia sp. WU-CL00825 TaxID=3127658 RepID=UPI003102D392
MDIYTLVALGTGALVSGFVSGFAGFGTALFASAFWFAVLPAHLVPPLVILAAVAGQIVGLARLKRQLTFKRALPLISGGIIGVPIGTLVLFVLSPWVIKLGIGLFLVSYALWQMLGEKFRITIGPQPLALDRAIGFIGGILGGIAGLAGPVPIVWLQLQALPASEQRARYQPFNLCILALSALSMAIFGVITAEVLKLALFAVPLTVIAAWFGVKAYARVSENSFRIWILCLLLVSGCFVLLQTLV